MKEPPGLMRAWVTSVTAGVLLGLGVPAAVATVLRSAPGPVLLLGLTLAGAAQGALLGWAQARVLVRAFPALSRTRWTALATLAGALTWCFAMTPTTLSDLWMSWPDRVSGSLGAFGAFVILIGTGSAQWLELHRHASASLVWIGTTGLAWTVGFFAGLLVVATLWRAGEPAWAVSLVALLAATTTAVTVAVGTGLGLRSVLRETTYAAPRRLGTRHVRPAPDRPSHRAA